MDRNRSIDAFRGLAIVSMVFFSLTLKLSQDLPEILRHNARGMIHLGDLVLPLFLFASGMSLAYFLKKNENVKENRFYSKVLGRVAKLAMVGIGLSYFSAFGFLQMDEVMLAAILFIICLILSWLDWKVSLGLVLAIDLSYLVLMHYGWDGVFQEYYLGGYLAAVYYLPIMLTGFLIGKGMLAEKLWCRTNIVILAFIILCFCITLVLYPMDKLAVTPSFMMFAILFSILIFTIIDIIIRNLNGSKPLEYLGRKPLRYWLMMYLFFMIPLIIYAEINDIFLPLEINWMVGVGIALGFMFVIVIFSLIIDKIILIYLNSKWRSKKTN